MYIFMLTCLYDEQFLIITILTTEHENLKSGFCKIDILSKNVRGQKFSNFWPDFEIEYRNWVNLPFKSIANKNIRYSFGCLERFKI